jgi:hypothetical protein
MYSLGCLAINTICYACMCHACIHAMLCVLCMGGLFAYSPVITYRLLSCLIGLLSIQGARQVAVARLNSVECMTSHKSLRMATNKAHVLYVYSKSTIALMLAVVGSQERRPGGRHNDIQGS